MKLYRLTNGQTSMQESVLNVEQDVTTFFSLLPHEVKDLPIIIMCLLGATPSNYKDFKVRRVVIYQWLVFLKQYNPLYFDIEISQSNLQLFPENGSIESELKVFTEEEGDGESIVDENDQQALGPEQGGASGALAEESPVVEAYLGLPPTNRNEEDVIRQALSQAFGEQTNDQDQNDQEQGTTVNWPDRGQMLSDYSTPSLQALLFPTLFPFGVGDVTKKNRLTEVSLTHSNQHLLNYALKEEGGQLTFPFAQHSRWMHWAQNTAERHRVNQQREVYLEKSPEDATLSYEELKRIVRENGPELRSLIARMHTYNANVLLQGST